MAAGCHLFLSSQTDGSASDSVAEEEAVEIVEAEAEEDTPSEEEIALQEELDAAVAAILENGYDVGYIIIDVDTGETLEYNADTLFYSASSIKGPFCVSLVRALGYDAINAYGGTISDALSWSSNDAYSTLRSAYYSYSFFQEFLDEAEVSTVSTDHWYAHYSARDLAKLWATCAEFLTSDEESAAWIGEILADTIYSTIDDVAGEFGAITFSKAGWYSGGGEEYDTTTDGGLVVSSCGTYAVAVLTSTPYDFDVITSVMEPLINLWEEMHASS